MMKMMFSALLLGLQMGVILGISYWLLKGEKKSAKNSKPYTKSSKDISSDS